MFVPVHFSHMGDNCTVTAHAAIEIPEIRFDELELVGRGAWLAQEMHHPKKGLSLFKQEFYCDKEGRLWAPSLEVMGSSTFLPGGYTKDNVPTSLKDVGLHLGRFAHRPSNRSRDNVEGYLTRRAESTFRYANGKILVAVDKPITGYAVFEVIKPSVFIGVELRPGYKACDLVVLAERYSDSLLLALAANMAVKEAA